MRTTRNREESLSIDTESTLPSIDIDSEPKPIPRCKTPKRKRKELVRNIQKRKVRFKEPKEKENRSIERRGLVLRSERISKRMKKARGTKTTL